MCLMCTRTSQNGFIYGGVGGITRQNLAKSRQTLTGPFKRIKRVGQGSNT